MREVSLTYERGGTTNPLILFDQPPAFLLDAPLRGLHEQKLIALHELGVKRGVFLALIVIIEVF
jgi:hypothetical protein